MFYELSLVLVLGFILDLFLGDPDWMPHPIVLIGKLISALEKCIRDIFPKSKSGERLGGLLLAILVPGISFFLPFFILLIAGKFFYPLKLALEVFWCWQILAAKTLAKEGKMVCEKVRASDLIGARKQVGRIVGRDTGELTMTGVVKACVETIAESTSDGVIAPLFFMAIGGIPVGFLYKAVNTLDSMVGYKNEKYRYFGTCSARLDDILNFIPARITAILMILVSAFLGFDYKGAFRVWKRDRLKHLSPNSGNPEAAVAGALGIMLGGDAFYFGELHKKATLGDDVRNPEAEDINRAIKLMYGSSALCLLILIIGRLFI